MTEDYCQSSTAVKFVYRSAGWGGTDGPGNCVRNSAFGRTGFSATEAAARHLAEGSAVGLLLLAGARAAAWAVAPLSVIVAVVT
jgi:hypothetical protein